MNDLNYLKLRSHKESSRESQPDKHGEVIGTNLETREFVKTIVPDETQETPLSEPQDAGASFKSQGANVTAEERRQQLIDSRPSERRIKREIRRKLNQQMKVLRKTAGLLKHKIGCAFELNNIVAQMRAIQEIFFQMTHAAYEVLKQLWLRLVHGIF